MSSDRKLSHKTKTEAITELLREKILRRSIVAGTWLRQDEIAQEFNISQSPVREALRNLAAEGLVTYVPHRGFQVTDFSAKDVEEFYRLRVLLECFTLREAILKLSDEELRQLDELEEKMRYYLEVGNIPQLTQVNQEWHLTLMSLANRPRFLDVTKRLTAAFPWDSLRTIPDRSQQTVIEHQEIMDAIRRRDADTAVLLMEEHLLAVANDMIYQISVSDDGHSSAKAELPLDNASDPGKT